MTRARERFGVALAVLGIVTMLVELGRYWIVDHPIHAWPVVIGALFGFVGFYLINPTDAKDAGAFVEGFTVRVLGTLRRGRASSTDVQVSVDPDHPERPNVTDDDKGVG